MFQESVVESVEILTFAYKNEIRKVILCFALIKSNYNTDLWLQNALYLSRKRQLVLWDECK